MNRITVLALTAAAGLALAGCSSSTGSQSSPPSNSAPAPATSDSVSPSASAGSAHNGADVMFAQMMIPHHAQAIEMAKLAATRAQSEKVKSLASRIEAAQQPEIDRMTAWLTSWGQSVPGSDGSGSTGDGMGSMGSGSMGSGGMATDSGDNGMMSDSDMSMLAAATGADFDRKFLTMMVRHHQGAIAMAKTEQASGRYAPATQLAASIVTSQSAEISTMQSLLASLT